MYQNTNDFFEAITYNSVAQIDIDNYVKTVTNDYEINALKTLYNDVSFFIGDLVLSLDRDLTNSDHVKKEQYYKDRGELFPTIKIIDQNGTHTIKDTERAFHFVATFQIRNFQKNILNIIDRGTILVAKNDFPKIFNSVEGFLIFNEMYTFYKNETNHLANFSFLYYAMEKDFLVCSQTEYKEFLSNEKYNIEIDKIDSRQSGKNKKANLYNSIIEKYKISAVKAQ